MKIIANYHHAPCAFAVGQIVTRQAFVDCFGVSHPRIDGLRIERIALIPTELEDLKPYYRVLASNKDWSIEGGERFFEAATCD